MLSVVQSCFSPASAIPAKASRTIVPTVGHHPHGGQKRVASVASVLRKVHARVHGLRPCIGLALCLALGACGTNTTGDFGRKRPSAFAEKFYTPNQHPLNGALGEQSSKFPLTDHEQELRARAYHFLRPADQRGDLAQIPAHLLDKMEAAASAGSDGEVSDASAGDSSQQAWAMDVRRKALGLISGVDASNPTAAYFARAMADPYRSPRSRYLKIINDVRSDRSLLPPLCAVVARVRDADAVRMRALLQVPNLEETAIKGGHARIAENERLIRWLGEEITARPKVYRYALERLVVATPDPEAISAERELRMLEDDAARGCSVAAAPIAQKLPDSALSKPNKLNNTKARKPKGK